MFINYTSCASFHFLTYETFVTHGDVVTKVLFKGYLIVLLVSYINIRIKKNHILIKYVENSLLLQYYTSMNILVCL